MPKYVIEREIPGIGSRSPEEFKAIAQKSNAIMEEMGPGIQWGHSYVVGDKIFCVFIAKDEETIREHARKGGFPCNTISEIATMMDPITAES
jgi:hypothetical protein